MTKSAEKKFVMLRGVVNGDRAGVDLPSPVTKENLQQVWTVYDHKKFEEFGLRHLYGSFIEDRMHDWDLTKDGKLRFYGHSGERGELHDLALVYK